MDLNTVTDLVRPRDRAQIPSHRRGDAFLAGGTALFSEQQAHLTRLVDLGALLWPALAISDAGLRIAATCTMAALAGAAKRPDWPAAWTAGTLLAQSCDCLWGSFKILNAATIGGNLCLALPASPMAALAVALDATCVIWTGNGGTRTLDAAEFITDAATTALAPGEILRELVIPRRALTTTALLRQASLTAHGRSGALVIGTRDAEAARCTFTITAAVRRPVRLRFPDIPDRAALARALDEAIPPALLYDDIHGRPAWRRHMTHLLARDVADGLACA